jgi:hypothetical protein
MVDGSKLLPRKKTENSKETNSHTGRQLYRSARKKNHGGRHTECMQANRHAGRQGDRQAETNDTVVDMKTWMLTKGRRTTELDERNRSVSR